MAQTTEECKKRKKIYKAVWRWHFYAGIFFAPLIVLLSITGGIYLFKPQIEDSMYHDLYYVEEGEQKLTPTEQITEVERNYPNAEIISFTPSFETDRSSVVSIEDAEGNISVYVNPYNGEITGSLNENDRFMAFIKLLHNGELWGGTIGNRLVELAACWTIILIITGAYLWWPTTWKSIYGTFIPRIRKYKGKRLLWRDLHAVTAIWFSLFLIIQLFSGLMWSDIWGGMAHRAVETTGAGSPVGDQPWETHAFPESSISTKEVADVPWAAENLPVPNSTSNGVSTVSAEKVMQIAQEKNIHPGYQIVLPKEETGVYTVYLDPAEVYPNRPSPHAQQTLHIDQYSGEVLEDYGWDDYGSIGKLVTYGIAFHQGEFGIFNQLLSLILVIAIILIPVSGLVMWWKRKPNGKLGAPALPENFKMLKGVTIIVLSFSIFFPLVGLSLLLVWVLDWFVIKRIPAVKQWLS